MPDVEDRLRAALGTLADEVAPTAEPRVELERRLDARRRATRRMPALAAAAAAVVVAAVLVPVVLSHVAPPAGAPAGQATGVTTNAPSGTERPELGTVSRDGQTLHAIGYLNANRYCTALERPGDPTTPLSCEPVPAWPEGPNHSLVQSRELLNGDTADDTGMLANRLVFLTHPRVATLTVRPGNGTAVTVREIDRNEHAAVFLVAFAGPHFGFGYTARDASGKIVEEAIS